MTHDQQLTAHYASASFADDVDQSLRVLGKDPQAVAFDDLEQVDEFHMGGRAATRALFDASGIARGATVADIGSGLGGPARVGAAERDWRVHGVDITAAYVAVATELSRRVGLAARTTFTTGSALASPLPDAAFDGAYMIHVGMNIADKATLAREARRVLKSGAPFAIYDIMRIGDGDLAFPLPWSALPETSAVARPAEYRAALQAAGFEVIGEVDCRGELKKFAEARGGFVTPPTLPHSGTAWETRVANLGALVKSGVLAPTRLISRAR